MSWLISVFIVPRNSHKAHFLILSVDFHCEQKTCATCVNFFLFLLLPVNHLNIFSCCFYSNIRRPLLLIRQNFKRYVLEKLTDALSKTLSCTCPIQLSWPLAIGPDLILMPLFDSTRFDRYN